MAESKRKIEFETRKRIFDLVGDEGACAFCKIIPRKGPIYQSEEGDIVCSTCKDSEEGNFQQNNMTKLLEKLCQDLVNSSKMIAKLPWIFRALNIMRKTATSETLNAFFVRKFSLLHYYLII